MTYRFYFTPIVRVVNITQYSWQTEYFMATQNILWQGGLLYLAKYIGENHKKLL